MWVRQREREKECAVVYAPGSVIIQRVFEAAGEGRAGDGGKCSLSSFGAESSATFDCQRQ
jgi:hypothetical protein